MRPEPRSAKRLGWAMLPACALVSVVLSSCKPGADVVTRQPSASGETTRPDRLPTGLRRLTNREFRKAASSLLGFELGVEFERLLPPDVRQEDGYARNYDQTMSGALAVNLEHLIPPLASKAVSHGDSGFTCMTEATEATANCIDEWIAKTSTRAWRRQVASDEIARLRDVYRGASDAADASGSPQAGAAAVLTALLLSADLWYVRELGDQAVAGDVVLLTPYEVADQIAVVMRGTLADQQLLADAAGGALSDAAVRQDHARRLLARDDTREHYREFVMSWLEVDKLEQTSKSAAVFELFEGFKPRMLAETRQFTDVVFMAEGASVNALLGAGFVSVDPEMAVYYGLNSFGSRVSSESVGRLGVLQHASFLASHSQSDTTSPVLRGDFVLRKLLCHRLPRPSELDIEVLMPRPRRDMTRREQFALHGADPRCAGCHDQIDGFGLVLEEFDAAGRRRQAELGKPVRTDGAVRYSQTDHRFGGSADLVRWLQSRRETSECFARQMFRFVTGRVDASAERAFLELRNGLPGALRDNVLEHLVAYVGSESFVERRRQ